MARAPKHKIIHPTGYFDLHFGIFLWLFPTSLFTQCWHNVMSYYNVIWYALKLVYFKVVCLGLLGVVGIWFFVHWCDLNNNCFVARTWSCSACFRWLCPGRVSGQDNLQSPLPTTPILWSCTFPTTIDMLALCPACLLLVTIFWAEITASFFSRYKHCF